MPVSRRLLFGAIAARLAAVTNATGYYAQIGKPLLPGTPVLADPPAKSADDPRVKPYFVLYPGAGADGPDPAIVELNADLSLDFRITAAGGDVDDVLALVDRLDARLLGWAPAVADGVCGRVGRFPGTRPPLLPDRTVSPERLFVPLQYLLVATT